MNETTRTRTTNSITNGDGVCRVTTCRRYFSTTDAYLVQKCGTEAYTCMRQSASMLNPNLVKPPLSITCVSNVASFWHFANSTAMILPTVLCVKLQNYSTTLGDVIGPTRFGEIWIQVAFQADNLYCDSTQGLSQYPIRRLIVRSHEVWKPWDW